MFRLMGFLIGSASAIGVLLLVLGIPEFHLPAGAEDQQRFDAAVEKLKEKQQEIAEVAEVVVDETATAVETVVGKNGDAAQETMPEPVEQGDMSVAPPQAMGDVSSPAVQDSPLQVPRTENFDTVESFSEELQWYSFWNPFRSEIAANGFVAQLEKVTGLDYRVVKVKTGVYEVAFAYADDLERRDKLNRIALATGLDLPGS